MASFHSWQNSLCERKSQRRKLIRLAVTRRRARNGRFHCTRQLLLYGLLTIIMNSGRYMKIKPTEMQASGDGGQIKPKVLPLELIRRHSTIAFVGILHDNLETGFSKILDTDPSHRWNSCYIFFPSDRCLENSLSQNYSKPVKELIASKHECRERLHQILKPVVDDLRFLQYDELKHCGSYWDWREPGKKCVSRR